MDVCPLCVYVVLSCVGRGLCYELIRRPKESKLVSNRIQKPEKGIGKRRQTFYPEKVTIYTQRFKYRLHVSSLTNYDGFVQWFAAGYMRFKHGSLDAATQQLT
jgi:hypothetical protein